MAAVIDIILLAVAIAGNLVESALSPIIELYRNEHFAYQLAGLMLAIGLVLMVVGYVRYRQRLRSVNKRIKTINKHIDRNASTEKSRTSFANAFTEINEAFSGGRNKSLSSAWHEFSETIIDETETPIRNSARPQQFFVGSVKAPRWLEFAANLSVGFGLLFTFLGLVAALNFASEGMASDDMTVMQSSLRNLLSAASAKFVTSIAGVGLSLFFRMMDRRANGSINHKLAEMCRLLERGFLYAAPQTIAAESLEETKQQTHQLKSMGESIASNVNSAFRQALEPMIINIKGMHDAMVNGADEQRQSMQKAINDAAGQQMQQLSSTLGGLSSLMTGFDEKIEQSSAAAAEELRLAGSQIRSQVQELPLVFKQAGEDAAKELNRFMSNGVEQLETLQRQLDQSISRLATFDDGLQQFRQGIETATTHLAHSVEQNRQTSEAADKLVHAIGQLSETNLKTSEQHASTVQNATEVASTSLKQAETLHAAITQTQDQISRSWESYQVRFDKVDADLQKAVEGLARELENFHNGLSSHASRVDTELARSINRLVDAYDALNETVDNLSAQNNHPKHS